MVSKVTYSSVQFNIQRAGYVYSNRLKKKINFHPKGTISIFICYNFIEPLKIFTKNFPYM